MVAVLAPASKLTRVLPDFWRLENEPGASEGAKHCLIPPTGHRQRPKLHSIFDGGYGAQAATGAPGLSQGSCSGAKDFFEMVIESLVGIDYGSVGIPYCSCP